MIFKHRVFWMHSTFHQKIQTKNVAQKKVSLQHFAPSTPCGFASFSSLHNCRRAWQLKKMAKIFSFSREMDCRSLCTTLKQQQEINAKNSKCRNAFSYLLFLCKKKRVSEIRKLPENINTLCTKLSFKTQKSLKKEKKCYF